MIPTESTDVLKFTPDVFKDVENPPTFTMRSPDDRHIRRYDLMIGEMNLERFDPKAMNAERRKAIAALYDDRAQSYLEKFNTILASDEQGIAISDDDMAWLGLLQDQLFDQWPPLARMKAKNREFYNWAPDACISTMVIGWTGLNAEQKKDGLYISGKALMKAANEMVEMERALKKDEEDYTPISYIELWGACQSQMHLTEDEEKNSHAPSKPSLNQDASTENNMADGASIAASGQAKSIFTSSAPKPTQTSEAKA